MDEFIRQRLQQLGKSPSNAKVNDLKDEFKHKLLELFEDYQMNGVQGGSKVGRFFKRVGRKFKKVGKTIKKGLKSNVGKAIRTGLKFVAPEVGIPLDAALKTVGLGKAKRKRKPNPKAKARGKLVSAVMKKYGVSLGEASKMLKENGM